MKHISPIEYREYQEITNMLADRCKEYKGLFKVLDNVAYKEVLSTNNLNKDLFILKYSLYNTYTSYTLKYIFNSLLILFVIPSITFFIWFNLSSLNE